MSMVFYAVVRTARITHPYSNVTRQGRNGAFESKMVMISAASDRDYKHSVQNADGTITQERQSDFFNLRFGGPLADNAAKYLCAVDSNGKLISRRILVRGHIETYQAERESVVQFVDNGVTKQLGVKLPETRQVYVVENFEFLDANPVNKTATVVTGAQPAQPAQSATVAQPAQPAQFATVAQPAQPAQFATVAQPAQPATVAQPQAPVANTATAEVAPF